MNDGLTSPPLSTTTTPRTVGGSSSTAACSLSLSSSAASSSSVIRNPYLTKKNSTTTATFIGGAEKARRMARKKQGKRILRPDERHEMNAVLPKKLNLFDRFFAALLRTPPRAFLSPNNNNNDIDSQHALACWSTMCQRVGLVALTQPLPASYNNQEQHFDARAALVLLEARTVLAEKLQQRWKKHNNNNSNNNSNRSSFTNIPGTMSSLSAHYVETSQSKLPHYSKVTFSKRLPFTKEELYHIRPGGVFQVHARDNDNTAPNIQNAYLGVVMKAIRSVTEKTQCLDLVFYTNELPSKLEGTDWVVTPLAPLITELRCFEAMMMSTSRNVSFVHCLTGGNFNKNNTNMTATHTRFPYNDSDDDDDDDDDDDSDCRVLAVVPPPPPPANAISTQQNQQLRNSGNSTSTASSLLSAPTPPLLPQHHPAQQAFVLPPLNPTQDKAATSFLQSAQDSITLIQGPPGTGKTTLLVSVICRYLMESEALENNSIDDPYASATHYADEQTAAENHQPSSSRQRRRLMVCAPTNKAVSVLATRFLAAMNQDVCDCNAVMVGDADKLLVDEQSGNNSGSLYSNNNDNDSLSLRSIFLYQWMNAVLDDYRKIRDYFLPGGAVRGVTPQALYACASRLERRLINSFPDLPAHTIMLTSQISTVLRKLAYEQAEVAPPDFVPTLERLMAELQAIPIEFVWRTVLLSADVIFCTLASAGGLAFKATSRIDDLIVDEAAASTEPELCIPFHLRPTRLLVVGDPKQLPATVNSRRAIDLGLAKSLQERLMFDCNYEHIMLDVQYRMHPDIAAFPSLRFYANKIANGENVIASASSQQQQRLRLLDGRPYVFLQVAGLEEQGFGGSFRNPTEARVIVELVMQLQAQAQRMESPNHYHHHAATAGAAVRSSTTSSNGSWCSADRIRIITYYQAQVALLKHMLREKKLEKVVVATVDSSQGCEADIVLVSFVRSQGNNNNNNNNNNNQGGGGNFSRHAAGFLTDDRRMNVSLTRARHQLIAVGNARQMMALTGGPEVETLRLLAMNADERGLIQPYPTTSGRQNTNVNTQLDRFYGDNNNNNQQQQHVAKKPRYGYTTSNKSPY